MSDDRLGFWVVYRGAKDRAPAPFTVRVQWVVPGVTEPVPDHEAHDFSTLEEARAYCMRHSGGCCLPPHVGDDPGIVETWL